MSFHFNFRNAKLTNSHREIRARRAYSLQADHVLSMTRTRIAEGGGQRQVNDGAKAVGEKTATRSLFREGRFDLIQNALDMMLFRIDKFPDCVG